MGIGAQREYPATVGGSPVAVGEQIPDAVTEALSKALPERALAAWGKHRGDYTSGTDPRNGKPYVRTTFDYDGSAGAVAGFDGATGPASFGCLGSVMRGNVEEAEVRFPWKMLEARDRPRLHGRRTVARRRRRRLARGQPGGPAPHGDRQLRRRRDGPEGRARAATTARRRGPSSSAATS